MKRLFSKYSLCFVVMLMGMIMPNEMLAQTDWTKYKHSLEEVLFTPTSDIQAPINTSTGEVLDQDKVVYFYNVKAGKFLDAGGSWGTETALFERGLRCFIVDNGDGTYKINTDNDAQGKGSRLGWAYGGNTNRARGFYTDQGTISTAEKVEGNWVITPADTDKEYRISITCTDTNKDELTGSSEASRTAYNVEYPYQYYLGQSQSATAGRGNTIVPYYTDGTDWYYLDNAGNGGRPAAATSSNGLYNGEWIIVTLADLKKAFNSAAANPVVYADATFLMYDPEFNRGNIYAGEWKASNTSNFVIGNTYSGNDNRTYGGFFCARLTNNCVITQTVTVERAGLYTVAAYGVASNNRSTVSMTSEGNTATKTLTTKTYTGTQAQYNAAVDLDGDNKATYFVETERLYVPAGSTITIRAASVNNSTVYLDNFELRYYGDNNTVLYLDEDETSMKEYLWGENTTAGQQDFGHKTYYKTTLYLHRSFTPGVWNTFSFPMDLARKQLTDAFGEVEIAECTGTNIAKQLISFRKTSEGIEANRPYLIKVVNNASYVNTESFMHPELGVEIKAPYYTFNNISVREEEKEGYIDEVATLTLDSEDNKGNDLTFWGSNVKVTLKAGEGDVENGYYAFSGGDMYYFSPADTKTRNMKGFRCWITDNEEIEGPGIEEGDENTNIAKFTTFEVDDETTGIVDVTRPAKNVNSKNIYSIDGKLVRANANNANGLTKGMYIINGKKYVVK